MIFLISALRILKDAIFSPSLPLRTRFHLLLLQPITLITYTIEWTISRKFPHSSTIQIPLKRTPGYSVRAVIYTPKSTSTSTSQPQTQPQIQTQKKPLHLNIHGGGFFGGLPEGNARFCAELAEKSGAVVVSTSYRYAPVHIFPDAHEDVQDVAEYLTLNAERLWNADPRILTLSGFSVGGNLALAVAQGLAGGEYAVKGFTAFEGVVDFRLPPWLKPKPPGFPKIDPLAFLQPLFDAYAGPNRLRDMENPLLHPTLADISTLPQNMLFNIAGADILRDESTRMAERLEVDARAFNQARGVPEIPETPDGKAVVVRARVFEGQIHGWTCMPSFAVDVEKRRQAFGDSIRFLRDVHRAYGYTRVELS
ncbi:putative lipase/esterase family protein [Aspergillus cavernicola]|uniref:Lipase/esterase family protein n=1 Tax=Aspergillus cavernicola TaxID=176166 RepID=A0ABR4ID49_9EURO